ncbi:MAG: FAD-dependent oxidoreductase, partial [Gammaproteobacteria bacterium]|nr:FAD-dependent oxidoreductase [Gammaproteobacteria bacterium]
MTFDTDPTARRQFLKGALAASALAASPLVSRLAASAETTHDLLIIGAGNAGLAAAVFAAQGGARVVLVDAANVPGGTLMMSAGQMSAANTAVQRARGIEDSADLHFEDVMRISRGTADAALVRLAVDEAAASFDWLMSRGFPMLPDHPVTGLAHEPYSVPRYYWGERNGHSVLAVLIEALRPELERGHSRTGTGGPDGLFAGGP